MKINAFLFFYCFYFSPFLTAQDFPINRPIYSSQGDTVFYILVHKTSIAPKKNLHYACYSKNHLIQVQGASTGYLLHGVFKTYYSNEQLESQGEYSYGLKKGRWKYWHNNGRLQRVEHWKAGQLHGTVEEWDEYGFLVQRQKYRNGKPKQGLLKKLFR